MVRKDFTICMDDVEIAIRRTRYIQVKKQGRKFRNIPGYGMGPKKKPTYKERMEKKMKKQIKDAKYIKQPIREREKRRANLRYNLYY